MMSNEYFSVDRKGTWEAGWLDMSKYRGGAGNVDPHRVFLTREAAQVMVNTLVEGFGLEQRRAASELENRVAERTLEANELGRQLRDARNGLRGAQETIRRQAHALDGVARALADAQEEVGRARG